VGRRSRSGRGVRVRKQYPVLSGNRIWSMRRSEVVGTGEATMQRTARRLLQARGCHGGRIGIVYGRSLSDLREIRSRGLAEAQQAMMAVA